MKRTSCAAVTAATLMLLASSGCSQGSTAGAPTPVSSPTSTPSASSSASPSFPNPAGRTPAPTGLINEDTGEIQEDYDVPAWDPESRADAVDVATTAMRAFAHPEADAKTWWKGLEPLLSDQGAHDYAYVDPANIPASKVTGTGKIVDDASAFVAVVQVPTDAGRYEVTISRQTAADPWRVDRLTPPAEGTR